MNMILTYILIGLFCSPMAYAGDLNLHLFDLSGSVGSGEGTPRGVNQAELEKNLRKAGKGSINIVFGFGRKAEVQLLKATMPEVSGPREKFLKAFREAGIQKLRENLGKNITQLDRSKTDVHGALLRVNRFFQEAQGNMTKRLIIYSDMIDNQTFGLTLNKLKAKGSSEALIGNLGRQSFPFPDLTGVEIIINGYFLDIPKLGTGDIETGVTELKKFWEAYFKRTQGELRVYRTNY